MRRQIEGSRAIAETIAVCRPQVVSAYPITPQTHIVEAVGAMVKAGSLANCQFLVVESEYSAMSAAIGACTAGSRAYSATASQGLLYMAEALYNASGLGLPIVLTVANRAIGAPINIWNDQSDSMSQRDSGWVQLYAADNQAAVDLHVLAYRLAEQISVPVMVCMDGFVLTHAFEPIEVPSQEQVDQYLPPFEPRQKLDPESPLTIGAMVGPEAFAEVRYLADHDLYRALPAFPPLAGQWQQITGRTLSIVEVYGPPDAETAVLLLGSISGTMKDAAEELNASGVDVRVVTLTMYRPFPTEAVRAALAGAKHVVVVERAATPGAQGAVTADVRTAVSPDQELVTVVAGLGGRPVSSASLVDMVCQAVASQLPERSFLDLQTDLVAAELDRYENRHESGGHAENVLHYAAIRNSGAK